MNDATIEIAYHIPGRGGWRRKMFRTQAQMEKWLDRLLEREGNDVEVRYRDL